MSVKFSAIAAAGAITGTDKVLGVQAGPTDVVYTITNLATFFWNSPTLVTPVIGVATGTSLALGGATIGSNALAVTGTAAISGITTTGGVTVTGTTAGVDGMWLAAANQLVLGTAGVERLRINSANASYQGAASGFALQFAGSSSTVPVFVPNRADTTTGIGAQASGNVSIIAGGAEIARFSSSALSLTTKDLNGVNALTAGFETLSGNATASLSNLLFSGTLFTGGTGTTTFPQILVQPTGTTAVTTWNTSGTILGANVVSGFAGNFLDFHVAGGGSVFSVLAAGSTLVAAGATYGWSGRGVIGASADGVFTMVNAAASSFTRLNFGGTTSASGAIARDGAGIQVIAADGTTGAFLSGVEQTAPAAPAANGYRIFAQDNGAGKTQLMVIFSSGAAQQIAIQP